jgi:hypothetical protein
MFNELGEMTDAELEFFTGIQDNLKSNPQDAATRYKKGYHDGYIAGLKDTYEAFKRSSTFDFHKNGDNISTDGPPPR